MLKKQSRRSGVKELTIMTDTRLALSEIRGLLNDLLERLSGDSCREWLSALKRFLRKENPWGDALLDLNWVKAHQELGIAFDPRILPAVDPAYWHIPVVSEVTCNKVVETLRRLGVNVWTCFEDLDQSIPTNDRVPGDGPYVVSVRRRVEADEENENLSANDLRIQNVTGTTLLERLLLELAYYLTTGQHLDIDCWTLCSGSRDSDGSVPGVYWLPGYRKVYVDWRSPNDRSNALRARTAVLLP